MASNEQGQVDIDNAGFQIGTSIVYAKRKSREQTGKSPRVKKTQEK